MACYLVTGVAGFIAAKVAEYLLAEGYIIGRSTDGEVSY